jgi:cysteine desulfurase/selenocysteine lyase
VDFEAFLGMLNERTRLLALAHVSNALGTVVPVQRFIREAKRRGIPVLLDGAQAAPHMRVDVQSLDCDFYAFSGHKMCGPTGIGVLYGREALLEEMPPWQGGGDMILAVSFERTVYNALPYKFEAGTPHIAGAIGLAAAVDYLEALGMDSIASAEHELLDYATSRLCGFPGLEIIGTAPDKAAVVSFTLAGVHPHDLGTILDAEGVAIRTGHHCAMPVMDFFGVPATARASFSFYNTRAEVDRLVDALVVAQEMLG